jgi:hypothetical protein
MAVMVNAKLAFGKFPNLGTYIKFHVNNNNEYSQYFDNFVPSARNNHWIVGIGAEANARHPDIVNLINLMLLPP